MARPKSYDRAEAVRAVRDAFWEHGYEGLSISAIEERTGLGRFAIRTEFGGKEGLFLEALADYTADTETYMLAPLREDGTLDGIIALLRGVVTPHEGSPRRFGCLMVNTSVENASIGALVVNRNAGRIDAAEGKVRVAIDTVNGWRTETPGGRAST